MELTSPTNHYPMPHRINFIKLILLQLAAIFEAGFNLYNQGGISRAFLFVITSSVTVPIAGFVNRYIYSDWQFVAFFLILFTLDMATGVIKASGWWDETRRTPNTLSQRLFLLRATEKLFVSGVWMILVHFVEIYAGQQSGFAGIYSNYFGNGVLAVWLIWSILANLFVITKGQFPPIGLLKRLAAVKDSGNLNDLEKDPTTTNSDIQKPV